jgi:hypothetical protein
VSESERLFLSSNLCGLPQLVTYIATYPSSASLPTKETLTDRAKLLVATYPLLKARVRDARTTKPKWGLLSDLQVATGLDKLVQDVQLEDVLPGSSGSSGRDASRLSPYLQAIFTKELQDKEPIRVGSGGLMWRIVRYQRADNISSSSPQPAFIALTCNHVISDGISGQALLTALLSNVALESRGPTASEGAAATQFPPPMEATFNCRPSLGFLLHQVWYELVVPHLPRPLRKILEMKPCWPAVPPRQVDNGEDDHQTFDHVHLSSDRLQKLKALGKRNGIPTLHPVLQIAATVAFWIAVENGHTERGDLRRPGRPLHLSHEVPMSHRRTTLSHPPMSGVYVGPLSSHTTANDDLLFWPAVKQYATLLHSAKGQRRGREVMGSLRYVPDGIIDSKDDSTTPTGWEVFFLERSRRAPTESFAVSNLGFFQRPPGTIGMAWCQSATVLHPPVYINMVGHEGGLDITFSRLADLWTDENGYDPLEHLAPKYQRVLEVLSDKVDARNIDAAGLTFGSIRAMVQAR